MKGPLSLAVVKNLMPASYLLTHVYIHATRGPLTAVSHNACLSVCFHATR